MLDKALIKKCEQYMLDCVKDDSAHDRYHIYRVLNLAVDIASYETDADMNILIVACLLHDIGREAQNKDPSLCHAEVGAKMAYDFLRCEGIEPDFAEAVRSAILTHRFRSKRAPQSIEAKILFDADTIDATGAMGIARSLQFEGHGAVPLYNVDEGGKVICGTYEQADCFFREYEFKLKNLYGRLYTKRGKEIAEGRRKTAQSFYQALISEVEHGLHNIDHILD